MVVHLCSELRHNNIYLGIKLFIENGAKINVCSQGILYNRLTPLEGTLESCRGVCIQRK